MSGGIRGGAVDKQGVKYFRVQGTSLKRVPAGYDNDHPLAEYLKLKNWYIEYPIPDAMVLDDREFFRAAMDVYPCIRPFNRYLNRALENFQMPAR